MSVSDWALLAFAVIAVTVYAVYVIRDLNRRARKFNADARAVERGIDRLGKAALDAKERPPASEERYSIAAAINLAEAMIGTGVVMVVETAVDEVDGPVLDTIPVMGASGWERHPDLVRVVDPNGAVLIEWAADKVVGLILIEGKVPAWA